MEDKVFLDEAGLDEVGKVISKFYASKDDIKDLDSLKNFVDSHNEIKLHYITQEEYKKIKTDGKLLCLSDIYDPISIATIAPKSGVPSWNDNPANTLWNNLVDTSRIEGIHEQSYLLLNITPNHRITSDRVDKVQFNDHSLKDNNVRLQLAFGEKDNCLYWRLLNDSEDFIDWTIIKDSCATQWIDNLKAQYRQLNKQVNNKVEKKEGYGLSQNDLTNELLDKVNKIPEQHLTIERFPDGGDLYAVDKEGLYIVNAKTTNTPIVSAVAEWEQEAWFERKEYPLMGGYYALLVVFFEGDKKHLLLYDTLTSSAWEAHVPKDYVKKEDEEAGVGYWQQHGNIGFSAVDVINLLHKTPYSFHFYSNGYEGDIISLDAYFIETVLLSHKEDKIDISISSKDDEETQTGTFLLGATENSAGVMSADDKKKLNSIDLEKCEQQEKDIKSMKEEIAQLKSQIEKLQASINNKE